MYRHLLVPIDATDLSIEVVGSAVALARSVGARVTFFHAVPDHAASLRGDAEVLRMTSPDDHAYAVTGKARRPGREIFGVLYFMLDSPVGG